MLYYKVEKPIGYQEYQLIKSYHVFLRKGNYFAQVHIAGQAWSARHEVWGYRLALRNPRVGGGEDLTQEGTKKRQRQADR
ncbi:hypothetical protein FSHL1_010845 [Fusarium sambucinum]